jgi:sugar phosphate isomerase/epimerase
MGYFSEWVIIKMTEIPTESTDRRESPSRRRLSICEITTKNWTFDEDARGYKAAGIDGLSVWWDKLKAFGVDDGAKLLREIGLPAVSMVSVPFLAGKETRFDQTAFDELCRALDDCAALGIDRMGVVPGNRHGRSIARMEELSIEALSRLAPEAAERGVVLALEPIHAPYFDFLNTLTDADRLVRAADHPAVGIMFDAWHLCHEPDLHAKIEETIERIALVHFSDWREPTRCHDDRMVPGEGVLPLVEILRTLDESGYRGFYDVEIFSEDVWRSDYDVTLRKCRAFFDATWQGAHA